jgi:ATP-binding cassette, subfamily B, bacterial MsbA
MPEPETTKTAHPVRTFLRFFAFLLPYWDKVLFTLLVVMILAPLAQIEQLIKKTIIDQVIMNNTDTIQQRIVMLFFFTIIAGAVLWSGQLLERLMGFFQFYLQMFVTIDLRKTFYRHLHKLSLGFFQDRPIGEHMYRTLEDIRSDSFPYNRGLVDLVTTNATNIFRTINDIIWQGLLVLALNPMAGVFIGVTIVPYVLLSYWMHSKIKRAFFKLKAEEQTVPAIVRDSIAGVETVKSYGRRRYMSLLYVRQLMNAIRAGLRRDYLTITLEQLVFWVLDFIAIGSLWTFLVYQLMIGEISVGSFYVLLNLSTRFIGPFKTLINNVMNIRQQLVPAERVLQTLDVPPAIEDIPGARALPRVAGHIKFENVSFAYDPAVPVLKNISFEIPPGGTLGIVGRSGAGKTTILNLLLRLQRPDSGRILIDGMDLDKVRGADWQQQVGVVLQNTFMFGGDVAYNVRYGHLDATEGDVWRALHMADADEFVATMPKGIFTDLAEGSKLSGGQKQRLGIARALIRNPRVLILDEPTSSLDSKTENEIWRSFEKAMQSTTAVVISHRLTTVRKADRIIVLDRGGIVESGTHDELVRGGGLYSRMWRDQAGSIA